ncbi:MAG: 3-phosphoshikimate 1-carboxyvinyltransferase [Candidatus Hydrogenedentes bacterium]|nr:3-phosphoshikimate 1-carboxyvinyltransferase [Candidatus Hydrogenedentota bacterium]
MKLVCTRSQLCGSVEIPGSKSHTIRAVAIAALAPGESFIRQPLDSADTRAAVRAYQALGAYIDADRSDLWTVQGAGGQLRTPNNVIDVANSGTTLRIALGSAALLREGVTVFTGDDQIRRRPAGPLAKSLTDLGAKVRSTRGNGCAPLVAEGLLCGGETSIEAVTSQYLTSLLINTPLAERDSAIHVTLLNEAPYVGITLDWLKRQGVVAEHDEAMKEFHVPGGQQYRPVDRRIPGDFSSATFFLAAGAMGGNDIVSAGLDLGDTQGDKAVIDYLRQMNAQVEVTPEGVRVRPGALTGCEIDMNATPDALPMMAVLGCFTKGTTRLVNVPQARLKETDRIAVMRTELEKMGAKIVELPDGLVIEESALHGAEVDGHDDHRVVMALAIAGTMIDGWTTIHGYEAVEVTFPGFVEALNRLGAKAYPIE